jgi:hypothetical protein
VAIFSLSGLGAALKNLTAICERANAHGSLRIAVERTRWPKPTA